MYYIGIDAGGTKTSFSLYTESGELLDNTRRPSCHFMRVGYEKMAEILMEGVMSFVENQKIDVREVVVSFGLAGYGKDAKIRSTIDQALSNKFEGFHYCVYNDVEAALSGAFKGEQGIILIAGTGSMAYAINDNEMIRAGGFGYAIGDEGSAYWIAKRMLETVTKMEDGRLEKTSLYQHLLDRLSLQNGFQLIGYVMNTLGNERDQIASLAQYLYEAAQLGDSAAISIYKDAAKELSELVKAVSKEVNGQRKVAYYGGVFKSGAYILDPLKEYLGSTYHLMEPTETPEFGAFILAKRQYMTKVETKKIL